jgi:deazaflavin-dependent oxidoreductase (nitroreductase family)
VAKTGSPPRWLKHVNKVIILMNRLGLAIENGAVLTVAGRRTGAPRRVPVSVMRWEGQRYLLAGYPDAEWPRNVRAAAGAATLSVARRVQSVRLYELDVAAAEPILRAWPARIPKGAKVMLDAGVVPDVTPESFAALAGRCAVFRIEVA